MIEFTLLSKSFMKYIEENRDNFFGITIIFVQK
jgi:hypothetical protein